MARKKQTPKQVRVTVLVAFNGMYAGDTAVMADSDRIQGWADAGLVRIDGTDQAGPGEPVADDPGGVAFGAGDSGASGDEPSQGFGAGSYGAPAGVDQGGSAKNGDAAEQVHDW